MMAGIYYKDENGKEVRLPGFVGPRGPKGDKGDGEALKAFASGAAVRMDDVSPLTHEMAVKVRSENLLDASNPYGETAGSTTTIDGNTVTLTKGATGNTPSIVYEIGDYKQYEGKTLTLSFDFDALGGEDNTDFRYYIIHGNVRKSSATTTVYSPQRCTRDDIGRRLTCTFTLPIMAEDKPLSICFYMDKGKTEGDYMTISKVKLAEAGEGDTIYTPFVDVSAVKVVKYGKNLLPYPYLLTTSTKYGVTCSIGDDGGISVSGTLDLTGTNADSIPFEIQKIEVKKGVEYTLSLDLDSSHFSSNTCQVWVRVDSGVLANHLYLICKDKPKVFTPLADGTMKIVIQVYDGYTVDLHFKALLELGNTASDFEPYTEPTEYTVNADGLPASWAGDGVTSLSPTTTLMCDTEGVIFDVEYNRDLNKAFDEIVNAIIALGGNV